MRIIIYLTLTAFLVLGVLAYYITNNTASIVTTETPEDLNIKNDGSTSLDHETLDHAESRPNFTTIPPQTEQHPDSQSSAAQKQLLQNLPRSLQGTDINGGFEVDENNQLIISSANKDFFEYFLTTLGEESLEQILDRMTGLIEASLPSPAQEQAIELLHNYLELKRALMELEQQVGDELSQYGNSTSDQHKARLEMVSNLRSQHLGENTAEIFFGESEAYDHYMLDRMTITNNSTLSQQEKDQALLSLMKDAPESIKPRLEDDYTMQLLTTQVSDLKASGANAEEIYQTRAAILGEDAASRLAEIEEAQAHWDERYQNYRKQKESLTSADLDPDALSQEVESLQQQLFEPHELRRVQALDRIN